MANVIRTTPFVTSTVVPTGSLDRRFSWLKARSPGFCTSTVPDTGSPTPLPPSVGMSTDDRDDQLLDRLAAGVAPADDAEAAARAPYERLVERLRAVDAPAGSAERAG